jgi:hypothetical protein
MRASVIPKLDESVYSAIKSRDEDRRILYGSDVFLVAA